MRYRHLVPAFLTPERLLLALGVAVITLFALAFGWLQVTRIAKRKVEQKIAQVSRKIGVPIEIGKWAITPTGAHFEDIRIGPDAGIVISRVNAEVGLNPFSPTFGELDSVYVYRVRVKTGVAGVKSTALSLKNAGLAFSDKAEQAQKSIEKLFQTLPTEHLFLQSAGVAVVDDEDKPLLTVKGMKLLIEKKMSRVLFRIDDIRGPGGLQDENLQGRFELSGKSTDYRFFIRRKMNATSKANAWAVSGTVQKDLAAAQLTAQARRVPAFLEDKVEELLGKHPRLNLRTRLDLARDGDTWKFNGRLQSLGSALLVPLLSVRPVGPARFDLNAKGYVRLNDRFVAVDSATLTLPDRKTGRYGKQPVRVAMSGVAKLPGELGSAFSVQGHMSLPPTPCQDLLDAAPPGLLPAIVDFKLDGNAGSGLDFAFDSTRPENASFELQGAAFGCKVTEAPYAYSAEHLAGPFTLQREISKDEEPVEINVNPLSPSFTPLESIGKAASLAFVSSEDAAFYSHKGIDAFALESALKRDLTEKRIAVGGSTITMQTVKNLFLSQERTLSRKMQELFLAWHLEGVLSKERILEIYMNIVELGPGIYGITQASEHFFGKHPADLTLSESAYLATLLPAPKTRYRYFCNGRLTPNFKEMVHGLLRRMLSLNRISYDRYTQAISASIQFNDQARLAAKECGRGPTDDED